MSVAPVRSPIGPSTAVPVVCEAGPDTGASTIIGAGRSVIGRSPGADLTLRDPAVELHHLLLDVDADGAVRVVQLTGRSVARLGSRPLGHASTPVPAGAVVAVGGSRLRIGHRVEDECAASTGEATAQRTTLHDVRPVGADRSRRRRAAAGARHGRRRPGSQRPPDAAATVDDLGPVTPGTVRRDRDTPIAPVADVIRWVAAGEPGWGRSLDDGTMFRVHLGVGDDDADITTDLEPGAVLHVTGPGAAGVARSIVIQLVAQVAPDRLRVAFAGAIGWLPDGVRLPHDGPARRAEHVVVFVSDPTLASLDVAALRARLPGGPHVAVVIFDDRPRPPSASVLGGHLTIGALGRGRWSCAAGSVATAAVHAAGVEPSAVVHVAARLDPDMAPTPTPPIGRLTTLELLASGVPVETVEVVSAWRRSPAGARPMLWLGRDDRGPSWLQLGRAPVVVVGPDPAGRRRVLTTLVAGLALEHGPWALGLVLGEGLASPSAAHGIGAPLPPSHLVRELARPHGRDDRSTVIAVDLADGDRHHGDDGDGEAFSVGTVLAHASERALVVGIGTSHPWLDGLLADPAVTVIVVGAADPATARNLTGDTRAVRLGPDQILVRGAGGAARLLRCPTLDAAALTRAAATIAYAVALVGGVPPDPGPDDVRSCAPCPYDDSPWAPPSSDLSSEPTLATMSSPASSPC